MGSAALVAKLRGLLNGVKVGHTGTLDRFATGLMILVVGRATAFSEYFLHQDKCYRALFKFGQSTNTHDLTGEVLESRSQEETLEFIRENRDRIINLVQAIKEHHTQIPPEFSALKKDGKRYSDLARAGLSETPAERKIRVESVKILKFEEDDDCIETEFEVSSGTYIRAFARDLAESTGFPLHLASLKRISIGRYHLDSPEIWIPGTGLPVIIELREALSNWCKIVVSPDEASYVLNGRYITIEHGLEDGSDFLLFSDEKKLIAWARARNDTYKYKKVFN